MEALKCSCCGGDVRVNADKSIAECLYCGSKLPIPKSVGRQVRLYNRATMLRMNQDFDMAAQTYQEILIDENNEPEAYWGIALCRYGIEYVRDDKNGQMIPTCHRMRLDSFLDDQDYQKAVGNADEEKKTYFLQEGQKIDRILQDLLHIVYQQKPFDVFLCYKETDYAGNRTEDSVYAREIYDALTHKGFRVFYAPKSIDFGLGYEPQIFSALQSAKIMFVIGTQKEYYEAVWVRNEWSRFLEMLSKGGDKWIIPVFKGLKPETDFPKELRPFQAYNLDTLGYIQDITDVVVKHLKPQMQQSEDMQHVNLDDYIIPGETAMKKEDWDLAQQYFLAAMEVAPESPRPLWGLFSVKMKNFTRPDKEPVLDDEEQKMYQQVLDVCNNDEKNFYQQKMSVYCRKAEKALYNKYKEQYNELFYRENHKLKDEKNHWQDKENYSAWISMYKEKAKQLLEYTPDEERAQVKEVTDQVIEYRKKFYDIAKKCKHGRTSSDEQLRKKEEMHDRLASMMREWNKDKNHNKHTYNMVIIGISLVFSVICIFMALQGVREFFGIDFGMIIIAICLVSALSLFDNFESSHVIIKGIILTVVIYILCTEGNPIMWLVYHENYMLPYLPLAFVVLSMILAFLLLIQIPVYKRHKEKSNLVKQDQSVR